MVIATRPNAPAASLDKSEKKDEQRSVVLGPSRSSSIGFGSEADVS